LLICTNHKILGNKDFVPDKNASPWGIVSVKPQDVDFELPMEPITMMRNALPDISEGGSGVHLCKKDYEAATKFWQDHAIIL